MGMHGEHAPRAPFHALLNHDGRKLIYGKEEKVTDQRENSIDLHVVCGMRDDGWLAGWMDEKNQIGPGAIASTC